MAEVEAPDSQDTTISQPHPQPQPQAQVAPHGTKRAADSSLESEQRLSKRFDLLNLVDRNGTRLYIPVAGSSDAPAAKQPTKPLLLPVAPATARELKDKPRSVPADDSMQVEDTPHRVYIHDLAAELSDIESDEENPIFLSDIEKHLAKIPKHVLAGPGPKPTRENQLVLYNVPASLTVPEEQDSVRKAIVEARARMRESQANPLPEPERVPAANAAPEIPMPVASDPDAMDID